MNNHLSQDEKDRWLLGQSRPGEEEHVRQCETCASELMQFRNTVSTFRTVMNKWSEQESVPMLLPSTADESSWMERRKIPAPAWALAAALAAGLLVLPVYRGGDIPQPDVAPAVETNINNDAVLMEAVATHLARPLPAPMERVLVLLPNEDVFEINEREELR